MLVVKTTIHLNVLCNWWAKDCPGGVIQSRIEPLRPLVSSALALDNPF